MKDYYYISYAWKTLGMDNWDFANDVTTSHPIDFIIGCNKHGGHENYVLISFYPISKEQYEAIKDAQ